MSGCQVLPGLFGIFVQGMLFGICVATLVYKKHREGPGRTWYEFGLDSSKQFVGAGWIHSMNLMCAIFLGDTVRSADQCEWYWINIMVDTTIGIVVQWLLLSATMKVLNAMLKQQSAQEFQTGRYYDGNGDFSSRRYMKQLCLWLVIVTMMKACMVMLMLGFATPLQTAAHVVLSPFMANPNAKLLVVMILTPVCMNSLQFWVIDNIIKKDGTNENTDGSVEEHSRLLDNGRRE
eukprot:TRINITY_DN54673_c0_g1_i1.p1 TRINITY_DN54673_c0_g1~~TRINITY_DN54673_c0_g1_i1.p1  ORF type:complete len:234 (+),score=35.29 TRINITY_DN54673_c0_g1_i1:174-875(+)